MQDHVHDPVQAKAVVKKHVNLICERASSFQLKLWYKVRNNPDHREEEVSSCTSVWNWRDDFAA